MLGIKVPAKVVKICDGDTIAVEVSTILKIRLLGVRARELTSKDPVEKQAAHDDKAKLMAKISIDDKIIVEIPLSEDNRLEKSITLQRFLGLLYKNNECINQKLLEGGVPGDNYNFSPHLIDFK